MRTSFHHQPEAQHPKFFSYPQAAGRLPHLMNPSGRLADTCASSCVHRPLSKQVHASADSLGVSSGERWPMPFSTWSRYERVFVTAYLLTTIVK
jgi:hypothetical protein